MPITKRANDSVELKFGAGDVRIAPATLKHNPEVGLVCFFRETDPKAKPGDKRFYQEPLHISVDDSPVRLVFTDTRSVDAVIRALEDAKSLMKTGELYYGEEN